MGIIIRKNVFETNSSSTHSITVKRFDDYDDVPDLSGEVLILNGGTFGWGYEELNDFIDKANYVAVDQFNNEENIDVLKEVIIEMTNCEEVILNFSDEWNHDNYSHIDHQSVGTSNELFYSKDDLKCFLFKSDSCVTLDNDN